jgi:hypothetical protein
MSMTPGDRAKPVPQMNRLVVDPQPAAVTTDEGIEGSGRQGNTAPLIPQASVPQGNASQAAGPDPTPVTASVKVNEPTENTGAVFVRPQAGISGSDNAETIAQRSERSTNAGLADGLAITLTKMFLSVVVGLTVAGIPYGMLMNVIVARRMRASNVRRDLVARLHARLQKAAAESRGLASPRLEDISAVLDSLRTAALPAMPSRKLQSTSQWASAAP